MNKLLPVFSYLFHPLFIPVYATLFYFVVTKDFFYQHEIYLAFIQVLIVTILLPVSIFYLLRSLGLISSKNLSENRERRLPLAFYAGLQYILIEYSFSILVIPELYYFFFGTLLSTLAALVLVFFGYRVSLHVMGISALTVFTVSIAAYYHVNFLYLITFFVVCTGFVGTARMTGTATIYDVVLGGLLGVLSQVALWFIWLLPSL